MEKLIFKAGYRLRQEGYMANGVSIAIGFTDKSISTKAKKYRFLPTTTPFELMFLVY